MLVFVACKQTAHFGTAVLGWCNDVEVQYFVPAGLFGRVPLF